MHTEPRSRLRHPHPRSRSTKHRARCFVFGATLALPLLVVSLAPRSPWLLYNRTPSVPIGFYVRREEEPRLGDLVAFRLPSAAHDYARRRGEPTDILLLKPVQAISGDHVSTLRGELRINGALIATIPDIDASGRALPRCEMDRVLADDELFVGSTLNSRSFDGRFFGPILASQIVGVYRRLTLGMSRDDTPHPPR